MSMPIGPREDAGGIPLADGHLPHSQLGEVGDIPFSVVREESEDISISIGEEMKGDMPDDIEIAVKEFKETGVMDKLRAIAKSLPAGVGITLWGVGVGGAFTIRLVGGVLDVVIDIASRRRAGEVNLFSEMGYAGGLAFGVAVGRTGAVLANKLGGFKELAIGINFSNASGRLSAATLLQKYYPAEASYEKMAIVTLIAGPMIIAGKIYDGIRGLLQPKAKPEGHPPPDVEVEED